jgi:hypothetical protein
LFTGIAQIESAFFRLEIWQFVIEISSGKHSKTCEGE